MIAEKPDKRYAYDLASRLINGIIFYPVLWGVIGIGSDLHRNSSLLFWSALAALTVIAVIRWMQLLSLTRTQEKNLERWLKILPFVHLPSALLWGLLFAYALASADDRFILLITFATAGIVPGGIYNFAPDFRMSVLFIFFMVLPAAYTTTFITEQWFLSALLIVYAIYIINLAVRQKNDYWAILSNELDLTRQSHVDPLTQLDNRQAFDQKLVDICKLSTRKDKQLSVMLIDCDHFRKINDEHGHDAGDKALQHMAEIIQQELQRSTDVCARYDGQEFSIILPGADLSGASMVAERIRNRIANTPLIIGDLKPFSMTVSIGCVTHSLHKMTENLPSELYKQADKALYEAKGAGRNCCYFVEFNDDTGEFEHRDLEPEVNLVGI